MNKKKQTYKDILGFDDKWIGIVSVPVVAILLSAMMFPDILKEDFDFFLKTCLTSALIHTTIYWLIYRQILIYFKKIYPRTSQAVKRIFRQSIVLVATYFLGQIILDPLIHGVFGSYNVSEPRHKLGMSIAALLVTFLVVGIYEVIGFYLRLQKSFAEQEALKRANIKSQLEGLKSQVNPHFLFNSLNTLTYIIPENADKAVHFVQKLSKVYRYILEIRDEKLIFLEEELSFLQSYNFLLKERFGENLHINVNVPETYLQAKIVPLSLQILFENAIKHNIISTHKPLEIKVFIQDNDKIVVKNNLQKKNQIMNSTKFGLQNIKNRYRFFSDKEVEVIVTQTAFMVILPLVEIPVAKPKLILQ